MRATLELRLQSIYIYKHNWINIYAYLLIYLHIYNIYYRVVWTSEWAITYIYLRKLTKMAEIGKILFLVVISSSAAHSTQSHITPPESHTALAPESHTAAGKSHPAALESLNDGSDMAPAPSNHVPTRNFIHSIEK